MNFLWVLLLLGQIFLQQWVNNSSNFLKAKLKRNILKNLVSQEEQNVDYKKVALLTPEHQIGSPINLTLPLWNSFLRLQLKPGLWTPLENFVFLSRKNNISEPVTHEAFQIFQCFYNYLDKHIKASVDLCNGLSGIVQVGSTVYIIKPLPLNSSNKSMSTYTHLILRINSPSKEFEKTRVFKVTRKKRSMNRNLEVKIETAVFVDQDLYKQMLSKFPNNTERNLFRFVLAMINAVQLLFHDLTLKYKVSFVLKRLEILHTDPPSLQRSHDIDRYLNSFCSWQEKENVYREKSPLHWDHALMLTGLDLYAVAKSGKISNQVLGLAPVAGMCKPSNSCTVNEGLHFESVYVVAHEIGHNLGMRHDGPTADNNCDPSSYIMSPTLGSGKSHWSACSNHYLEQFLQTSQARCLYETAQVELDHTDGGTLPGERFDANQQCMLKHGKQSEHSPKQKIEDICKDLQCTNEKYTLTSHPALEGTKCGPQRWCRFGRCVEISQTINESYAIDGGWSKWTSFSECASGCLHGNSDYSIGSTGISIATRTCNNPRPENGGKQCLGPDKAYKTCEAIQCSNIPPTAITEFAEQICRRAKEVDKDLTGLGFQKNSSNVEEACTVWCYQYKGGAKSRGWVFPDGTTCHLEKLPSDATFCISGKCEEFRCSSLDHSTFIASEQYCQSKLPNFSKLKPLESNWTLAGPCHYNCITPASGLRIVRRGSEHNIQLCHSMDCDIKKTIFEYATDLCSKFKTRIKKLSGLGLQLSPSNKDPDRPCHVACQDDKIPHRFYLVTGKEGWFPFGVDCSQGISGKKAFCIAGKCLEFEKNNLLQNPNEFNFFEIRRRRSLDLVNRNFPTVKLSPELKIIEILSQDSMNISNVIAASIDYDNPIHLKTSWK